jgi:tetratricopeptide (TPR) repeat protein
VRSAVVLGIDAEGSRSQNAWLDPAMAFAERAVALRPEGVEGHYWRGVAMGRRAMNASPGYAVELAQVVYDDAHAILAADSTHGGAHNMLGKLNYEIMSLSRIKRGVAKTFMGNSALDDTSWDNARHHLERATETWPDFVLFHFDLGQLHRKRGRREEAAQSFRTALALEAVHPTDRKVQEDARTYLQEWGLLAIQDSLSVSSGDAPTGR